MGFFDADSNVDMAQSAVDSAQRRLEDARANLATAKSNGNYKRALKNINYKGKKGSNI